MPKLLRESACEGKAEAQDSRVARLRGECTVILDLTEVYVRNQYTEMICAIMKRITAECTNAMSTPQDIAILTTSYADLVRATSGGDA